MNVNGMINKFSSEGLMNQKAVLAQVLLLLYGIFLLIFPAKGLNLSVGFIGIVFILAGILGAVSFFRDRAAGNYPLLAIGVISLVVGILTFVFRSAIAMVLFPVLLGVWTLVSTVWAAFAAYGNYRSGNGIWWVPLLAAVIGAVVTVLIFMNLSGTERFMARIVGIYFITYNIIRLGELAAVYFAPAPTPARSKSSARKKQTKAAPRHRVYEENANQQEFDIYDYKEEGFDNYRSSHPRYHEDYETPRRHYENDDRYEY